MKVFVKDFFSKCEQETEGLLIFTNENLNRKLHFLLIFVFSVSMRKKEIRIATFFTQCVTCNNHSEYSVIENEFFLSFHKNY